MSETFLNVPGNCYLPKHFEDDCKPIGWKANGKKHHGYCSKCKNKVCNNFDYNINNFTNGEMLKAGSCGKH